MGVTIEIKEHPTDNNADFIRGGEQEGTFNVNAEELTVGYTSAQAFRRGFAVRFTDVQLPPGSKILHACIKAQSSGDYPETQVNAFIDMDGAANSQPFSTYDELFARDLSIGAIPYENIPATTAGQWLETPDFAELLQVFLEYVNWEQGNAMTMILWDYWNQTDNEDNHHRRFRSYNHSPETPIILKLEFDPPAIYVDCQVKHPALRTIRTIEYYTGQPITKTPYSNLSSLAEKRLITQATVRVGLPADIDVTTLAGVTYRIRCPHIPYPPIIQPPYYEPPPMLASMYGHFPSVKAPGINVVARLFTPDTQTEVYKAAAPTDADGYFTITDIPPGTYDVGIKCDNSLSELTTNQVFVAGATTNVEFSAWRGGDLNNSDKVDGVDYSILAANYNKTGACAAYPGTWLMP